MLRMRMGNPHSTLFTLAAATALLLGTTAYAGDGTIHRVGEKVPHSYIVLLSIGEAADQVGPELEKRHGGKLNAIMKHVGQFSIYFSNEAVAEAIARDPRIIAM